jgi:hypothetical protein
MENNDKTKWINTILSQMGRLKGDKATIDFTRDRSSRGPLKIWKRHENNNEEKCSSI